MTVDRPRRIVGVSSGSGGAPLERSRHASHTSPSPPERPRLHTRGQIYVTLAAAQAYAEDRCEGGRSDREHTSRCRGLCSSRHLETHRRELTELLLDAHVVDPGPPERVRARSRSTQLDISATIIQEGRLLVVLSATARHYR